MITFIMCGLGLVPILAVAFFAVYGLPHRWSDVGMGWHIAAFTGAVALLVGLLLLSMLGVRIPLWIGAFAVWFLDAAFVWRLVLAVKARRGMR